MLSTSVFLCGLENAWLEHLPPERRARELRDRMLARIRDKEQNMKTRLERRREAIRAKWTSRICYTLAMAVAVPAAVVGISFLWKLAVEMVLSA